MPANFGGLDDQNRREEILGLTRQFHKLTQNPILCGGAFEQVVKKAALLSEVIEKDEMIRVLHAEHAFSDRFLSYMLSRNIRIEEDLIDQLLWQGTPTRKDASQSFPGDAGGNDWHNTSSSQLFHE